MVNVTNTTQLSTFSLVRDALLANSELAKTFSKQNIFQFEPKNKGMNAVGFPYIVITLPTTETDPLILDHSTTIKSITGTIILRVDYLKRDNVRTYCNNIIRAIESYEGTFNSSGYYTPLIELIDLDENIVINQKELVEGTFELSFQGAVTR